jgi:hypothetical protein
MAIFLGFPIQWPRDDSNIVAAAVYPAAPNAPRLVTRRPCEAGFLASGSTLASTFPRLLKLEVVSVVFWTLAHRLQLRGQPRRWHRVP